MLRSLRFWLGLLITGLFLFLFLYRTDFGDIGRSLKEAHYAYLVPAALITFVVAWFRTVRWAYLLAPLKKVNCPRLFPVVAIGYMANNVLPVRLGELVRAYVLGEREQVSKTATLMTIVVERVFDGLALLFFAFLISLFVPMEEWIKNVLRVGAGVFLGLLLVSLLLASSQAAALRFLRFLARLLPGQWQDRANALVPHLLSGFGVIQRPKRLLVIFGLSLVIWLIEASSYYLVVFAFDFRQPFYHLLLLTALANLAITLPSSSGGIGPFEYLSQRTLIFFGIASETATAYALVLHATILIPITLLGLFYLWQTNVSLSRAVRRQAPALEPAGPRQQGPNTR